MKKKGKIITSVLGATVMGSAVTIAAVAQACGPTNNTPPETNQQQIVDVVNQLSNYNTQQTTAGLTQDLLTAINADLNDAIAGVTIQTLTFTNITTTDVSTTTTGFSVTINNVSGVGSNNGAISGNLTLIVANDNNQLSIASGALSGINISIDRNITAIVASLNVLSAYSGGTVSDALANQFLTEARTILESMISNITIDTLAFTALTAQAVVASGSNYTATIARLSGTGSSNGIISGNAVVITITNDNNALSIGTNAITNLQVTNDADVATLITSINGLNNYNVNTPPSQTTLQTEIIAAINFRLNVLTSTTSIGTMNFSNVIASDIAQGSGTITVTVLQVTGITNNGMFMSGAMAATFSVPTPGNISLSNNQLVGISLSASLQETIANDVNVLSTYTGGTPANVTSAALLNNITTHLQNQISETTVATLVFTNITFVDVVNASANTYVATVNSVTGTTADGNTISGTLVATFTATRSGNPPTQLNITSVSANGLLVASASRQTIATELNELSNYSGTAPTSDLGMRFLELLSVFVANQLSGSTIDTFNFTQIQENNIVQSGNTFTVTIPGISGTTSIGINLFGTATIALTRSGSDFTIADNGVSGVNFDNTFTFQQLSVLILNEVRDYTTETIVSQNAEVFISALESYFNSQFTGSNNLTALNFDVIPLSSSVPVSGSESVFTVSINNATAMSNGNAMVAGTIVATVRFDQGDIASVGITGPVVTSTTATEIINGLNFFSNYENATPPQNQIEIDIVEAFVTFAQQQFIIDNVSLTTVSFTPITLANLTILANGDITVVVPNLTGAFQTTPLPAIFDGTPATFTFNVTNQVVRLPLDGITGLNIVI